MNKRLFAVLLLPSLLLSCSSSKEITAEVAKERAQNIQEKQKSSDFTLPKQSKTTLEVSYEAALSDETSANIGMTVLYEKDIENYYYHNNITVSASYTSPEETAYSMAFDFYLYMENETLYAAQILNDGTKKTGLSQAINYEGDLNEKYFDIIIEDIDSSASDYFEDIWNTIGLSSSYLNSVDPIEFNYGTEFIAIINSLTSEGTTETKTFTYDGNVNLTLSELTFQSSGEGNLETHFKGSGTTSASISGSTYSTMITITYDMAFDNYLFKNCAIEFVTTATIGTNSLTSTAATKMTQSQDVTVVIPDTENL